LAEERILGIGGVRLDRDFHRAYSDGEDINLTPLEYRLLEVFLERRGQVQTRAAWNTEAQIETRTVDMHVARLRAKLGGAGDMLETVRGVGYLFRGPE